ncbi:hypothetical protein K1719_008473 [Acacia pycnantha]|nr:hypothetical protein K1719_008473 [Acacia pycnantha]
MEIHEMPDKNTFLFRFTKQEDYVRVLKGCPWSILGTLLNLQHWDDYMILSEVDFDWCPFWIQFHGLPHAAFDCENAIILGNTVGRLVMNCKFLLESADAEDTVVRYGNGLGITHVKTIEEALVIHDQNWDEAILLWDKPAAAAAGQPFNTRTFGAFPKDGNKRDLGDKSAISPPRPPILINAPVNIDDTVMVINQSEPRITEVPSFVTPTVQNPPSLPQAMQNSKNKRVTEKDVTADADLRVVDVVNAEAISNPSQPLYPQPMVHMIATSPESSSLIKNTCYLVESPSSVPETTANITSHAGLSPLSAVTSGLNRIQLKRQQDHLEMELNPTPMKRRLLFLEPAPEVSNNTSNTPDTSGNKRVNFRKLKNSIRAKRDTNKHRSSTGKLYVPSILQHAAPIKICLMMSSTTLPLTWII